ncbi:MAG TPA: TIR domain-containing protein, partial [Pyrinomonadaceae bacterium]|nr:TIR domain-containing protein [Pyrinomonadaceae bacterium]
MARGRLTVFLGSLILADVPLAIRVDSAASANSAREVPSVPVSATPYRKIFPSYSHKDRAIVEQIEHHVRALGDKYLRDVSELRAGQDWQRWMREAIEEADMFQLFWSHNSMHSAYVRQEWEYALSLGRPNFVRPTYWEEPLPENPAENLPPAELRQLHFQHLRANTNIYHPTTATTHSDDSAAAATRPGGDDVVCASCGARNPSEKAFCQNCGATLSAGAQSQTQTAADSAQALKSALEIFWEKRPRETVPSPTQSLPSSQSDRQAPPLAASGRTWLRFGLLFFIVLIIGIVVGIYLLVRFL